MVNMTDKNIVRCRAQQMQQVQQPSRGHGLGSGRGRSCEMIAGVLAPGRHQPSLLFQSMQRGKQRAGADDIGALRDLLDAPRHAEPVKRLEAQRLEDEGRTM